MADVARDQDLVGGLPLEDALAVGQGTVLERRVDHDLVLGVGEALELALVQAEPHASS